jgi:hypothetical protein
MTAIAQIPEKCATLAAYGSMNFRKRFKLALMSPPSGIQISSKRKCKVFTFNEAHQSCRRF